MTTTESVDSALSRSVSSRALRADCYRQLGGFTVHGFLRCLVLRREFRPIATLRLCQALFASAAPLNWLTPLGRILHRVACQLAGVDLPWRTAISGGFCLNHGWGTVISEGARIGSNVTMFHGATLGQRDRIDRAGVRHTAYPIIEDDVWIGPHAIIVGGVRIGRGSRVAGGAYVSEDVPPYSVVGGNPAVILKSEAMPDVKNPAPASVL
jgi:serine O-acetyltransferase